MKRVRPFAERKPVGVLRLPVEDRGEFVLDEDQEILIGEAILSEDEERQRVEDITLVPGLFLQFASNGGDRIFITIDAPPQDPQVPGC